MSDPIGTYPLVAVVPGVNVEAGDFGVVEVQVVLKSWNDPPLTLAELNVLIDEAIKCARWALHHGHLTVSGSWIAAACSELPGVTIRLELLSWDVVSYYAQATRH